MRVWFVVLMLLTAPAAFAQTAVIVLGPDVSTLLQYRVYPHLQSGLLAIERGDETTAISELTQARRLAPGNAAVAGYLAEAYRKFGRIDQARALLMDQLRNTPGDTRLSDALSALTPPPVPPPATAPAAPTAAVVPTAPVAPVMAAVPIVSAADRDAARAVALRERRLAEARKTATEAMAAATLGFAEWNAGHIVEAQHAFERAWQLDPSNLVVTSQLVYLHQQLANNTRARWFAEQAIDGLAKAPVSPDDVSTEDRRFGFSRLHEDLGRRLSLSVDGFSGSGAASTTGATGSGRAFNSYAQAEADLRLGRTAIRNGSTVSLYARVFADGGVGELALPTANPTVGAGVRWKPLGNRVLYVMAEGQQASGNSHHDLLFRSSMSLINSGRWSDDWHPSGRGWVSRNLYLDAAYYAVSKRSAFAGDYRMSYHRRVHDNQTVEPFARLQVNGFSGATFQRDVRVGVGARWNLWSGGSVYDAFPHKLSAGIEFQRAIDTYLPGRNGVFLSVGVHR